MKKFKRLSVIMCLLMLFTLVLSASVFANGTETLHAHEADECAECLLEEDEIAPRAVICANCGKGTISTNYESITRNEEVKCNHHKYGTDLFEVSFLRVWYKCSYTSCGWSVIDRDINYTRTLKTCGGYNG